MNRAPPGGSTEGARYPPSQKENDGTSGLGHLHVLGRICRWAAFSVIQGVEHEDLFDADLNVIGSSDNHVGDVAGFAPPGDIHRVHNTADTTAISIQSTEPT